MRLIYIPDKEIEKVKNQISAHEKIHVVMISSEYGKYKKGDFVKTTWGEKLVITDVKQPKSYEDFEKESVHYPEFKGENFEDLKLVYTHKKVEIVELRNYREKN
ncbi:hypothetical protein J4474_01015 [Candidatus Pacearchaeota archaeon]|nr:hypothetical protein [Candidatus Pacearchaeota archaeon]